MVKYKMQEKRKQTTTHNVTHDFFKPHIPRFAETLSRYPKLFTALHSAVEENEVTMHDLKRVGAKFVLLDPKRQASFKRVLKTAEWLAKKQKVSSAVELMAEHVEVPQAFGLRDELRVKRGVVTKHLLEKLAFGFKLPDKHELVLVSKDLPVLTHAGHSGSTPGQVILAVRGNSLIVKNTAVDSPIVFSWKDNNGCPIFPKRYDNSSVMQGSQLVDTVHGPAEVVIKPSHRFSIGPSQFEFISAQRNGFALRGTAGPAKGKAFVFDSKRATIGSGENDHIKLTK